MKNWFILYSMAAMSLISPAVFSQTENDSTLLGLPGDNLDLYAVLNLFLKSKTIEGFEKSLNEQKTGINNLDLDLDKKVDFIKVVTKKEGESYTFILQVAVSKTETQDVAVILVNRDKNKKVSVQIVGDEDLYGKDYVIEPKPEGSAVTANPAYVGPDPAAKDVPASTTVVVVQTAPVVQYVYSPVYVPYYPPYHYGYYPPYFAIAATVAIGIYRHNNYYYHGGYYGGYHGHGGGNTVIINNRNQINHYNNTRNTSNTVRHNNVNGSYGNRPSTRPSNGASASNRPSTRPANGPSASTRPANGPSASTRQSNGPSASQRQSASNFSSGANSMGGRTRNSGGGGYSGGGNRGGGGFGGSRGGGGGRRR